MSSTGTEMDTEMNRISPRPRPPMYPDVPWWAVLVTAFVFSVVGVVIGAYSNIGDLAPTAKGLSAATLVVDTISYTPHIILLFGVLADMFTLQGVWSIPSLVGLLSVFANYVFQYFWKGLAELIDVTTKASNKATGTMSGGVPAGIMGTPIPAGTVLPTISTDTNKLFKDYNGCYVQGLKDWNTPYAPQTLVVTATVFSYYCYDLIRNRGWINSLGGILGFFAAFLAEAAIIGMNTGGTGCDGEGGVVAPAVRALFEGLLFGGVSYSIVQTYAPNRLPSSVISPFPSKSAADLSPGPDGRMYDRDGYPYIVLPNGQAFPDVSDAKSRAAFGALAAESTGTNVSLGSNCPASPAACPNA